MKKLVFMLVGPPCSGKSTFINLLRGIDPHIEVVDTDSVIEEYARSHNSTYNECFKSCIGWADKVMKDKVRNLTEKGVAFFWDQTNMSSKSRKKKLDMIPKDWTKVAVVFETPLDVCWKRMETRDKKVPYGIVKSMIESYERPTTSEGFDMVVDYHPSKLTEFSQ